jgi:hypothetical protein
MHMNPHSHQPLRGRSLRCGAASTATALLSILVFATPPSMAHAAEEPAIGATVARQPAADAAPTGAQRKSKGGRTKPFLGGSQEGTGIRQSAPVGPKAAGAAAAKKNGR